MFKLLLIIAFTSFAKDINLEIEGKWVTLKNTSYTQVKKINLTLGEYSILPFNNGGNLFYKVKIDLNDKFLTFITLTMVKNGKDQEIILNKNEIKSPLEIPVEILREGGGSFTVTAQKIKLLPF